LGKSASIKFLSVLKGWRKREKDRAQKGCLVWHVREAWSKLDVQVVEGKAWSHFLFPAERREKKVHLCLWLALGKKRGSNASCETHDVTPFICLSGGGGGGKGGESAGKRSN